MCLAGAPPPAMHAAYLYQCVQTYSLHARSLHTMWKTEQEEIGPHARYGRSGGSGSGSAMDGQKRCRLVPEARFSGFSTF